MQKNSHVTYDGHPAVWQEILSDPNRKEFSETWFKEDTLDYWRHERMRAPLVSIVNNDPKSSWLTVGDGRYGTDGHYLLSIGAETVHCSDLSDTLLKIGNQRGFIKDFSAQNAESLIFDDASFDYIYCKESFHHFPRPYLALNEMFRVARKGVVITEPRDIQIDTAPFSQIWKALRRVLLRGEQVEHRFEPTGNYLYSISEREIEKFLLGMHFTEVAYNGCNDAYTEGVELIPFQAKTKAHKIAKFKILTKIKISDIICSLGFRKSGILSAVLFKKRPTPELITSMKQGGWQIKGLPINPYLK